MPTRTNNNKYPKYSNKPPGAYSFLGLRGWGLIGREGLLEGGLILSSGNRTEGAKKCLKKFSKKLGNLGLSIRAALGNGLLFSDYQPAILAHIVEILCKLILCEK